MARIINGILGNLKGNMKLTKNFSKAEFDSKDGAVMPMHVYSNVIKLAGELQRLRDVVGVPIKINSGYRSPEHNAKKGGSKRSQHLYGRAADIVVQGKTPKEVYDLIEGMIACGDMLQGGLGLYDSFVHYDVRGAKARWNYSTLYK